MFIYTLSDFYAFAISLFSIILLDIILNRKQAICKKGVEGCILGLCLYGAYNIRTIYLFLGIASLGVLTASQLYKKKWTNLVVTLLACFVGIVMCAIPQMIVNNNLGGGYSWQVSTGGLMSSQIQWGINYQRYGTYIGDPLEYGDIRMFYIDNIGQTILNRAQITDFGSGIAFIKNFIKLIVDYPLDFIGIYVRHFLNMLYPIYPEQYIQEITKDKSLLLILFYSLFFIATSNFIYLFKQGGNSWRWICLILVPCFCILPGAVEIRFFIALHFLIYIYAVLGIKEFWGRLKKNKKRYICVYVIGLLLYIAYGGMLLATTAAGTATINNL